MPHYLKMTEDADGSTDGRTTRRYLSGQVYSATSKPAVDAFLFHSFVSSGRAVECDADGNPLAPATPEPSSKAAKSAKNAPTAAASDAAASTLAADIEQAVEAAVEQAATPAQAATQPDQNAPKA